MQIKRETERERRERRWKIRSEPLLKLREEVAFIGAKTFLQAFTKTIPAKERVEEFKKISAEIRDYILRGDTLKVMYSIEESNIFALVDDLMAFWGIRLAKDSLTDDEINNFVDETDKRIGVIQSAINQQLEKL